MKSIRIGAGAGFAGDRIDPAVDLAERGKLDFLIFECLAERTIALAQLRKREDPTSGYDPLLEERMTAVLPACHKNGTRVIGNMGAANPAAAAKKTVEIARKLGLTGLRVAYVEGDDVLALKEHFMPFEGQTLPTSSSYLSANAYLGADPITYALDSDADVVLTGRVADPSLFLGCFLHSFKWDSDSWNLLGQGIVLGHLLECAGQLTGGYFADPGYKDVPCLHSLGFPLAVVAEDGSAVVTKLENTGGLVNVHTCREQLLYEVLDPSCYVTPDVLADLTNVRLEPQTKDAMRVTGGKGQPRPLGYKVSIGIHEGYLVESQISYAGPGALARAELARDVLSRRLADKAIDDLRFDIIGLNSIHGTLVHDAEPYEVRLRVAARSANQIAARVLPREVESLYVNGPAGGGGITSSLRENVAIVPALISRDLVRPTVSIEVA